jgi:hypothetical protein
MKHLKQASETLAKHTSEKHLKTKRMQHPDETCKTLEIYAYNMHVYPTSRQNIRL